MSRLLLAVLLIGPLLASDADQIRKTAHDVTQSLDVQRQLPDADSRTEVSPSDRDRRDVPDDGVEVPGALSGAPGAIWEMLRWVLVAVAVVAVVALVMSWLSEQRMARGPVVAPAPARPRTTPLPVARPDQLLALADEHAAAGRFSEAMHCVLLAATAMLHAPDSLTSWEVLRTSTLAPPARQALRNLILSEQLAWFGKRAAGREDYQAARGMFGEFAGAVAQA